MCKYIGFGSGKNGTGSGNTMLSTNDKSGNSGRKLTISGLNNNGEPVF